MKKINKKLLFTTIFVYLVTSALSFLIFSQLVFQKVAVIETPVPDVEIGADGKVVFDDSLPKTEECPLNGALYSKQQRKWWESHRPLGVMIENSADARPQSGLSSADVVYEISAEGGISRFLAVYHCQDAGIVGPVRSARTYFLDFISEYGNYPLYAHVGGANTPGPANALGQIEEYGWAQYNDLNQFSIGFPTFYRDYDRLGRTVATEHTMYAQTLKLWELAEKRGLTNVDEDGINWDENFTPYIFKDDAPVDSRPTTQTIEYNIWSGMPAYTISWKYDKTSNSYLRSNGGEPHTDLNNDKQIEAKNIVLLYMRESRANDGYEGNLHLLYGTKGTGKAVVFQDGKRIDGTWSKKNRTSRTIIEDKNGNEIEFNRGLIWFNVLPSDNDSLTVK